MTFNHERHNRRSIRLGLYDYSQSGAYFFTLCTWNRECVFGKVVDNSISLNEHGKIVAEEWNRSSMIRKEMELDEFIVMPNHVHGIVLIHADVVGANGSSPLPRMKPKSLSSFMAGFKSTVTKRINEMRMTPRSPVWQRNYYEHIVRNAEEMNRIREYIRNNPIQWEMDENHPDRVNP